MKMITNQFVAVLCLFIMISLLLASFSQATRAAEHNITAEEPKLRAAIVLGILRFTNWPEDAPLTNSLNLCTAGGPSSSAALAEISSKRQFQNLPIVIYKLNSNSSDFSKCNVLVMGANVNSELLKNISDSEASHGVLTVCDNCKTSNENAMVYLVRVKNRIAFKIDLSQSSKNGMKFSSSLLELATEVVKD